LEIIYFKELESTQKHLLENLKENICIWTDNQTNGIGSRGNSWIGEKGNLFFSFSLSKKKLPKDLPIQSISIYFMYILKMVLNSLGSKVVFKWPNDLYLKNKVGGIITNIKNDIIIVGIGLNTNQSSKFDNLDIKVDNLELLKLYFNSLNKTWSEVFEKFEKEFYKYKFITQDIDLSKVKLNKDGSIQINNERIYSLRWKR